MNTSNLSNCAFPGNPHNDQNIPIILYLFVVLHDYPGVIPQSRQLFLQVLDPSSNTLLLVTIILCMMYFVLVAVMYPLHHVLQDQAGNIHSV